MRFKITILFLFLGLFASAQFHSPYYHASVVDSLILKHRGDTLIHIRLSHNRDTLFINNSYFVGGGGGIIDTTILTTLWHFNHYATWTDNGNNKQTSKRDTVSVIYIASNQQDGQNRGIIASDDMLEGFMLGYKGGGFGVTNPLSILSYVEPDSYGVHSMAYDYLDATYQRKGKLDILGNNGSSISQAGKDYHNYSKITVDTNNIIIDAKAIVLPKLKVRTGLDTIMVMIHDSLYKQLLPVFDTSGLAYRWWVDMNYQKIYWDRFTSPQPYVKMHNDGDLLNIPLGEDIYFGDINSNGAQVYVNNDLRTLAVQGNMQIKGDLECQDTLVLDHMIRSGSVADSCIEYDKTTGRIIQKKLPVITPVDSIPWIHNATEKHTYPRYSTDTLLISPNTKLNGYAGTIKAYFNSGQYADMILNAFSGGATIEGHAYGNYGQISLDGSIPAIQLNIHYGALTKQIQFNAWSFSPQNYSVSLGSSIYPWNGFYADTSIYFYGLPVGNSTQRMLVIDTITGQVKRYPIPSSGTTYTAGYGLGLSGTAFYNSRYWGTQDSLKTSLSGLVLATAGKLTAITNSSSNWDAGYTYRLTGATGSAPLTLGLSGNALTGSIDTTTSKTGLANLYQLGLKANKATTITINGTGYDISSNRSWTIPNYWQRTSTTLSPTTAQDNLQVYSNQYTTGDFENTHSGSDPAKAVYGYIYGSNAAPNYAFYATASGGSSNYSFYGNAGMFLQNDSSYFGNYLSISPISAPSPVTDKLYNVGHSLYWNGAALGTGTANVAGGTVGAVPYQSAANTTGVVAATATAGLPLISGANAIPTWATSPPLYKSTIRELFPPVFVDTSALISSGKVLIGYSGNITIDTLIYVLNRRAGTPSITPTIKYGTDWTASGTSVVTAPGAVTSYSTPTKVSGGTLNNITISAGNLIWMTWTETVAPKELYVIILGHYN